MSAAPAAAKLARGRYLVENVALCFTCHSPLKWGDPLMPVPPGKKGSGGLFPDKSVPFPLLAPNITPDPETGAGKWTDAQFARAIREGIGHDGRRLYPVMPYMDLRAMSDDDLAAVIAYVRSIPPVRQAHTPTPLPEQAKAILPPPMPLAGPVAPPDKNNPVKRGEYLVHLGVCSDCHTPVDQQGRPLPGLDLAGGGILDGPWGRVASANLTPDPSGLSYYDEKRFIEVMRTGKVGVRKLNPIMLTSRFQHMTDDDLKAIFAYLKTLKPVSHRVDNTEPPTLCRICGQMHGYGNKN